MELSQKKIETDLVDFIKSSLLEEGIFFDQNTYLWEVGLDSISIVSIILYLERNYKINLSEEDLNPENLKSVKAIADCCTKYF